MLWLVIIQAMTPFSKEYGGLTGCPHTVTGKIIEIERMNQTEVGPIVDHPCIII